VKKAINIRTLDETISDMRIDEVKKGKVEVFTLDQVVNFLLENNLIKESEKNSDISAKKDTVNKKKGIK